LLFNAQQPDDRDEYGERQTLWLLDDACDQPGGDWEVEWDSG